LGHFVAGFLVGFSRDYRNLKSTEIAATACPGLE